MPITYTEPRLLICEGRTDVQFFRSLLLKRGINGFQVDFPKIDEDPSGGVDKFGQHLRNIALQEDFIAVVTTVILVSDNDDGDAFNRVGRQITLAGYTVPNSPGEIVATRNRPRLGVLMLPAVPPGCLETLCQQAAQNKWPTLNSPLDAYMRASPATTWTITKQAKTAIECIMAATCEEMPEVSLSNLWQKKEQYHIPLDDPAFDFIETFLQGL